ncbi:sulfate adenylyltransferase subunit CysD [Heliobacillus mobilis]|uniref:Sulfate adenylyltransferase subunit 2 n=1 Tax=Heliobacterium mobile TaxID=28064 RepID=A0A6I3SHP4_HELMO|nr:sulfate adenylyltransferase subunit CysD [Heliobacterium mobile]MTV48227.1 sulfate adenylyltransferase subunit CysD [Heliobacterium mobile]
MEHLERLESESIYIIREAYRKYKKIAMLWSIGKDSTVLLHLARKAFYGHCPIPLVHIDTTFKIPEMITYRDKIAQEWGLKLVVGKNEEALRDGMNPERGRLDCCTALKTEGLQQIMAKHEFQGLLMGIRRDEEGSRGKERYFSPRNKDFEWNFKEQPPELWNQFQTEFPAGTHVRVHPLLHWTELNVWQYILHENIPVIDLYFSKNGKRYRSLGCAPCTAPITSEAKNVEEIIEELKNTRETERSGRAQDQVDAYAMQKLRVRGYM